jgi:hypothetical protein
MPALPNAEPQISGSGGKRSMPGACRSTMKLAMPAAPLPGSVWAYITSRSEFYPDQLGSEVEDRIWSDGLLG